MNRKKDALINFLPVLIKNSGSFLKTMLRFVEDHRAAEIYNELSGNSGIKFVDLLELCPGFSEDITDFTFLPYTSRVTDIALLKFLAKNFSNCAYLEIGSFRGESLINVSPVVKSATSISLSKEEMKDFNFSEDTIEVDGFLIKNDSKIKRIFHNSLTYDFSQLNQKFDLIFIDGDHSMQAVEVDTRNAIPLLKDENSMIVWHDFGNSYTDVRHDVAAGALKGLKPDERQFVYRVQNTLCGVYTKRQLNVLGKRNLLKPTKVFDVKINTRVI